MKATFCPACEVLGLSSDIQSGGIRSTLMDSSDDYHRTDGHHHDDNNVARCDCQCSNGHDFTLVGKSPCPHPDCDFGKTPTRITVKGRLHARGGEEAIVVWPMDYYNSALFGSVERVARFDQQSGWILEKLQVQGQTVA